MKNIRKIFLHVEHKLSWLKRNVAFICHSTCHSICHSAFYLHRVGWTDSFEMLKKFTKHAIQQPGNWLSPGGKYKKFTSSNSDLIFTWNYELGTLSFKGEMGDRLKELFITVCMMGKSLTADHSGFAPVALNNDKPLSVSRTKTKAARVFTDNDSARS